jgi:hypothetical protein
MNNYEFGKEIMKIMSLKHISIETLSKQNKINIQDLELKLNGKKQLSADEIIEIMLYFNLSIDEIAKIYEKCKYTKK